MNFSKRLVAFLFSSFILVFAIGCGGSSDTTTEGCTDEQASNYDSDADTDDGSCRYRTTFWTDQDFGEDIEVWVSESEDGTTMKKEGTVDTFFTNTVPDCEGADGTVEVLRDKGTYYFEVKFQSSGDVKDGKIKFDHCHRYNISG